MPLPSFIGAAIVGLAVKWGVFAAAIHEAVEAAAEGEGLDFGAVLFLLAVAMLFIVGALWRRRSQRAFSLERRGADEDG